MTAPHQNPPRRGRKTETPGGSVLPHRQVRLPCAKGKRPHQAVGGSPVWPQSAGHRHPSGKNRSCQPGGREAGRSNRAAGRHLHGRKDQPSRWIAPAGRWRRKRSHRPARGEGFGGASFGSLFWVATKNVRPQRVARNSRHLFNLNDTLHGNASALPTQNGGFVYSRRKQRTKSVERHSVVTISIGSDGRNGFHTAISCITCNFLQAVLVHLELTNVARTTDKVAP